MNWFFCPRLIYAPVILALLISPQLLQAELIEDLEETDTPTAAKPQVPVKSPIQQPPVIQEPIPSAPSTDNRPTSGDSKVQIKSKSKSAKVGVVKFWSKTLSGLRSPGTLMLEEDVVVTQDDIRLEADKATIFFEPKSRDVREVHAVGSVRFSRTDPDTGQPIRAEGREAIFSNSKRLITMKGEPVLHRGEDVVRGKIIYYDLKNGWVKADRVEGVVQPAAKKSGPIK